MMAGAAGVENASAQKFELGARVGIGSQNMNVEFAGIADAKARLGWNAAAVARIRLVGFGDGLLGAGLFLQPEVVYSNSSIKGKWVVESVDYGTSSGTGTKARISMQTVDVPLLLSLKVSLVRVQAGPVFSLMNNFKDNDGKLELQPLLRGGGKRRPRPARRRRPLPRRLQKNGVQGPGLAGDKESIFELVGRSRHHVLVAECRCLKKR